MERLIVDNEKELAKVAEEFARKLRGGEVVALTGPLGSGKTTFVKGMARALGVKDIVTSPSFILLRSYQIPDRELTFHHLDLYRLDNLKQIAELGLSDLMGREEDITFIEWAEKAKKILPQKTTWIYFDYANGGRVITIKSTNYK